MPPPALHSNKIECKWQQTGWLARKRAAKLPKWANRHVAAMTWHGANSGNKTLTTAPRLASTTSGQGYDGGTGGRTKQKRDKMDKKELMMRAIRLSEESVRNGGGPFGAVIARNGEIVAEASNSVTPDCDPTAHAEVNAIRMAARNTGSYDLSGCEIFTSCEPCPMCLGAIYWAHLDKIYYANDRKDAAGIGFDDDFIYKELELKPAERHKPSEIFLPEEAKRAFEMWKEKDDKREY